MKKNSPLSHDKKISLLYINYLIVKKSLFSHKVRLQDSAALVKSTIAVFIFTEICKKNIK